MSIGTPWFYGSGGPGVLVSDLSFVVVVSYLFIMWSKKQVGMMVRVIVWLTSASTDEISLSCVKWRQKEEFQDKQRGFSIKDIV